MGIGSKKRILPKGTDGYSIRFQKIEDGVLRSKEMPLFFTDEDYDRYTESQLAGLMKQSISILNETAS